VAALVDSWGVLAALGAFHGLNPAMGWLFAVALGMQESRSRAVWLAIVPIAVGHACAIAVALLVGLVAGIVVPTSTLRWVVAGALVLLGALQIVRPRHLRWGHMRLGPVGLGVWSFLVATVHGAGLMVLPVWLGTAEHAHAVHADPGAGVASGLAATAIHSGSYLIVTAAIAWIVFHKVGVGVLRRAWINLDLIWGAALILGGALMVVTVGH
jgi:hypothetical protein